MSWGRMMVVPPWPTPGTGGAYHVSFTCADGCECRVKGAEEVGCDSFTFFFGAFLLYLSCVPVIGRRGWVMNTNKNIGARGEKDKEREREALVRERLCVSCLPVRLHGVLTRCTALHITTRSARPPFILVGGADSSRRKQRQQKYIHNIKTTTTTTTSRCHRRRVKGIGRPLTVDGQEYNASLLPDSYVLTPRFQRAELEWCR